MRPIFDKSSDHGQILDNIKQLSFYSDIFSRCKWSTPSQVISKELSKSILSVAQVLIEKDGNTMTTEAELLHWVKHLRPVWKQDISKMKQALINCYQEAEDSGLIKKRLTKQMFEFVF